MSRSLAPTQVRSAYLNRYTISLSARRGRTRTTFRAGFALMVIGSLVKGLMPCRSLVAGFRFTVIRSNPGTVLTPEPLFDRSALITEPRT